MLSRTFFFLLTAALPLCAQEPAATSAPQVRLKLAPGTECTATIRYPRIESWMASGADMAKIKLPAMVAKRVLSYTGEDAGLATTFSDKTTQSGFFRGKHYLSLNSKTGVEIADRGAGDAPEVDFRKVHFPELDWVNETVNRGIQKTAGGKYLVYEEKTDSPVSSRILYVDPETLYPVSFRDFNESITYAYAPAPSHGKLPLPEELAKTWEKMRADYKRYYKKEFPD